MCPMISLTLTWLSTMPTFHLGIPAKFSVVSQIHWVFCRCCVPVHDVSSFWNNFSSFLFIKKSYTALNTQFKCHPEAFLKFSMEIASFLHINKTSVHTFIIAIITT